MAFRAGANGMVALFRFGVAVMVGLSPLEEEDLARPSDARASSAPARAPTTRRRSWKSPPTAMNRVEAGGPIHIKNLSPQRFLVVADALAKTVALGRDEREVNGVFDVIEPFARRTRRARPAAIRRRAMLRLIGQALLAQHRVSGRVAVEEKPDVLWDRPDLERLYARLEDEYELKERAGTLKRKLEVIVETAHALTDIIDAEPRDAPRSDRRDAHRHGTAFLACGNRLGVARPMIGRSQKISKKSQFQLPDLSAPC